MTSPKLAEAFFKGRKQEISANSDVSGYKVMHGWGYIGGNGTSNVTATLTFPTAFSSPPVVLMTPLGAYTGTGTPDSIDDMSTAIGGTSLSIHLHAITASQASIYLYRDTGTFGSGTEYGYSWIAIGAA